MSLWRRLKERLLGEPEDEVGGSGSGIGGGSGSGIGGGSGSGIGGGSGSGIEGGSGSGIGGGSGGGSGRADRDAGSSSTAATDEIARLRAGLRGSGGAPSMDEVIGILRRVRGTLRETDAVAAVLEAMAERAVPDSVRVACADILATRGDEQGALRLLDGGGGRPASIASTPGLILAADLYAALGQLPRALGAIERVLAREIDAPGALERHHRWRAALGGPRAPAGRLDEATVVAPPERAGPFRLLREVARGGAGTVYEGEDEVLGRRVAFKVYHGGGRERGHLEREARLAAALAGPGVVRVLDANPEEGWIALEWVARGSVRDLLRGGDPASLVPIGRWAAPLARALARVHERGYVHADVKPANVLLRQPGEPVLGDFGIARPQGAPSEGGSPGYVSPERLAGRASDPRDDIYGYGRVLEDVLVRLDALEAGARSPSVNQGFGGAAGLVPAEPPSVDLRAWREIALRCLGPDEDRPEDGAALVRALP